MKREGRRTFSASLVALDGSSGGPGYLRRLLQRHRECEERKKGRCYRWLEFAEEEKRKKNLLLYVEVKKKKEKRKRERERDSFKNIFNRFNLFKI